ncbi:glycoside hydrolase family protein [bacterium]|nr:glycoside hydrolase family protein [bacterium]MBU1958620.1 glycoside hydrolase family protein [bacterium]
MSLIEDIKLEEGFSPVVYKCSEGFDTIGYGTRLPLSKAEAELILISRLSAMKAELAEKQPLILELPKNVQEIIFNMTYQMGINGVLNFKKMWNALQVKNYNEASRQMLSSLWEKQTPNRAKRLAERMAKS